MRGFEVVSAYTNQHIKLPQRSTSNSAGYDFYAPQDIEVPSHLREFEASLEDPWSTWSVNPFCIKTGIKAYMLDDEVLQLYMRSSAPAKLGLVMANSVGIIDSDYYNNEDNEGEIGFLVYNLRRNPVSIAKGEKLGQGIFTKYLRVDNDVASGIRTGGFGSTGI